MFDLSDLMIMGIIVVVIILAIGFVTAYIYWRYEREKFREYKAMQKFLMKEQRQIEDWRKTSVNPCWHCKKAKVGGCSTCDYVLPHPTYTLKEKISQPYTPSEVSPLQSPPESAKVAKKKKEREIVEIELETRD